MIAVAGAGKKQMEENYVTEQLREVISESKTGLCGRREQRILQDHSGGSRSFARK